MSEMSDWFRLNREPVQGCISQKHRKTKYIVDPLKPMEFRITMLLGNAAQTVLEPIHKNDSSTI